MAKKPSNLIYGVDESPRFYENIILGLEHIFIMAVSYIFPVIIVQEIGGAPEQAAKMIQMSMIAGGIGTIVLSLEKGSIGSGYLCPQVCGPSFLSASILAGKTAGLGPCLSVRFSEAFSRRFFRGFKAAEGFFST